MIKNNVILIALLILSAFSCRKNPDSFSQIKSQLRHKWNLISEHIIFPDSPRLNLVYKGISSDFYEFNSNGTLTINLAGTADSPSIPYRAEVKYWSQDQRTFTLDFGGHYLTNKIQTLTDNLLVFSNDIYLLDNNSNKTNGIRIDSLRR